MDMKRFFLYFITIAALTLAGCGGGGGTGLMVGGDRATQDAIDSLEARPDTDLTLAEIMALTGRPDTELTLAEIMALTGRPDTDLTLAEIMALTGRPDTDLTLAEIMALMGRPDTDLTLAEIMALTGRPNTELTLAEIMALMGRPNTELTLAEIMALTGRPNTELTLAEIMALMGREDITPTGAQGLRDRINYFETAQNASDNATGAITTAAEAVTAATEASRKLSTLAVGGNSMLAQTNAQKVLDKAKAVQDAVGTAQTALDNANAALAADADPMDPLTRALMAAITVAEDAVKDAQAAVAGDPLKMALAKVQNPDNDDPAPDPLKTPTDIQTSVAMDIGMALQPNPLLTDGSSTRVIHISTAPADTVLNEVEKNDRQGRFWAEIVGEDNIIDKIIAKTGVGTVVVKAASFAGMPAASITTDTPAMTEDVVVVNGTEYADANYKGIDGTAFCAGSDCNVDGDGDLTGSWYFTPTSETALYTGTTTGGVTTYSVETLYVRFGHWLTQTGDPLLTTINTYAMTGAGTTAGTNYDIVTVNTAADATTLTDSSAKYSGMAAGMSFHQQVDADGMVVAGTRQSGAFTAEVKLEATFGGSPTLGGTVSKFQSENGDAVDSNWAVEMQVRAFNGNFADGRTVVTNGPDGLWSAQAYGSAAVTPPALPTVRPEGIFGGFNAHFTDGHAAGAYSTRKD